MHSCLWYHQALDTVLCVPLLSIPIWERKETVTETYFSFGFSKIISWLLLEMNAFFWPYLTKAPFVNLCDLMWAIWKNFYCLCYFKKKPRKNKSVSFYISFSCIFFFLVDYRHNGRDLQSSTLSVPEQVMSSNHCSRSGSPHRGDSIGRTRSWSPSVPPLQR